MAFVIFLMLVTFLQFRILTCTVHSFRIAQWAHFSNVESAPFYTIKCEYHLFCTVVPEVGNVDGWTDGYGLSATGFFLYFSYIELQVEHNLHFTWYHGTVGHVGHKMAPLCNCTRYKGSCSCSEDELEEPMSHLVSLDSHTSPVRISHKRVTFSIRQCVAHQPVAESTYNWKSIESVRCIPVVYFPFSMVNGHWIAKFLRNNIKDFDHGYECDLWHEKKKLQG